MKVSIIGTGYVGLVSGTCFAELGHDVTCIDIDEKKVEILKQGKSPIYEPGLSDLITKNIKSQRLNFSTSYDSISSSRVTFLAVGTPSGDDGRADLKYLFSALESSIQFFEDDSIVVIKSTVPVGTCEQVDNFIKERTQKKIHVVNNPEFLKEGSAVADFMKPDRVVIGHKEQSCAKVMEELYAPLVRQGNPIYMMSNLSAEMTKYAANSFLATKISFINEIARLCDATGADVEEVRKGITSDQRIGKHFLYPGPGYGGSCFPKDVKALMNTAHDFGLKVEIVEAAENVNQVQKTYIVEKIKKHFNNDLNGKTFSLWGAAFKPNTDDIRESSAIDIAKALTGLGAKVRFFDPIAATNFSNYMSELEVEVESSENEYDCLKNSDGLVLVTEWSQFKNPKWDLIKENLKEQVIFDARNILPIDKVKAEGFTYYAIGKRV